jgi:hypothetical protein
MSWHTNEGKMQKWAVKNLNFQVILECPKMYLCIELKSITYMPDLVVFKDLVKIVWFLPENYLKMAIMTILRHFKSSFLNTSTNFEKSAYEVMFSDPKSI